MPRTAFRLASWTARTSLCSCFCNSYLLECIAGIYHTVREREALIFSLRGSLFSRGISTRVLLGRHHSEVRLLVMPHWQVGPPNLELSRVSSPLVSLHTAWTPTSADAGRGRRVVFFTSTRPRAARIGQVLFWVYSCVLYGESPGFGIITCTAHEGRAPHYMYVGNAWWFNLKPLT